MQELESLQHRFAFDTWADRRVLEALEVFARDREPADTLRGAHLFAHMCAARELWLARIRGEETSGIEVWPEVYLDRLGEYYREVSPRWEDYRMTLTAEELDRMVSYRTTSGTAFQTRVRDILEQLLFHGAHHRGQIASWLRASGGEPARTDYITFVREGN